MKMKKRVAGIMAAAAACAAMSAGAQVCTTQARMQPAMREEIVAAAKTLAAAVQVGDTAKVRALTVPAYATDFSASEFLIRSTAAATTGETLVVTSVYGLDSSARKDASGDTEFSCPLNGTALETDFSINSLPPGNYAFAMVEANGGTQPWLLSFLLQRDAGTWKMAGFYPHARSAAGHDGLWYWNEARAAAKAKQTWAAYLLYAEAVELLKPAGFVQSSHFEKLQSEQRDATPPELSSGVSKDTPLVLKGAAGLEFHFTGVGTARSDDGKRVTVALHLPATAGTDAVAVRLRSEAAAAAFVAAHPEVRKDFQGVWVFAENDSGQVVGLSQRDMSQIP